MSALNGCDSGCLNIFVVWLQLVCPHRLKADPDLKLGDVTSINVNVLEGGVQWNVVPDAMALKVDLRITLSDDHEVVAHGCLWK